MLGFSTGAAVLETYLKLGESRSGPLGKLYITHHPSNYGPIFGRADYGRTLISPSADFQTNLYHLSLASISFQAFGFFHVSSLLDAKGPTMGSTHCTPRVLEYPHST